MLGDTKNDSRHSDHYNTHKTLPRPLHSLKRHAPQTLLPHTSPVTLPPAFPLNPPLLLCQSPNCAFQGFL